MDIKPKDGMEIYVDENKLILKKYEPTCKFCRSIDDIIEYEDKQICGECIELRR